MNYDVGAHVDLAYLNRQGVAHVQKKSISQKFFRAIQVAEDRYVFSTQAARRIPVVYA